MALVIFVSLRLVIGTQDPTITSRMRLVLLWSPIIERFLHGPLLHNDIRHSHGIIVLLLLVLRRHVDRDEPCLVALTLVFWAWKDHL